MRWWSGGDSVGGGGGRRVERGEAGFPATWPFTVTLRLPPLMEEGGSWLKGGEMGSKVADAATRGVRKPRSARRRPLPARPLAHPPLQLSKLGPIAHGP